MTVAARPASAQPIEIEGYDIVRELGRGAMGVVYLGRDRVLERDVAIKVIGENPGDDANERFLREARAMARLAHPNVVTVFRAGVTANEPYVVMELLRGRSLEAVLQSEGPLPRERLIEVAIGAARGIAAAHARGIVHRDIKPSNLFEADDGTVKVLDFGIAKVLPNATLPADEAKLPGARTVEDTSPEAVARSWDSAEDAMTAATSTPNDAVPDTRPTGIDALAKTRAADATPRSTSETRIGGTPLYMAPEVWRQEFADHASDVFSFGATLYMLATGSPPFVGRTIPEIAFRVLTNAPAEPLKNKRTDLPEALCALVDRALAKSRDRRFASGAEMLAALERVSRDTEVPRVIEGSPYPGLRAMTAGDCDRFYGRDDDVARVLDRLRGEALVVLVGPSGAGKSSLAAAGVAPAVERGALGEPAEWDVVRITPGRSPLVTLAHALAQWKGDDASGDDLAEEFRNAPDAFARLLRSRVQRSGRGVLVLLDQLEEMVTLADSADRDLVSAALSRLIAFSPPGVRVLATARSDLFDRLATLGALGAQLGRATELVRPLTGESLRAAIVEPARAARATFEDPSIVDAIVKEAGTGEAALPLVAFAMRAWWDLRDRNTRALTSAGWHRVGGVMGALGAHAESVFESLATGDRSIARTVLQRVCAPDGTRRYATRSELAATVADREGLARVLDSFVGARLLLTEGDGDDAQVTLVHEALTRAWPRMMHWQREGREDRALQERVRAAADVWKAAGESRELLWRGALLDEIDRWRVLYDDTMSPLERAFADASRRERSRGRWRVRAAVGTAFVVLAVAAGMQWRSARRTTAEAVGAVRERATRDAAARAEDLAYAWRNDDPAVALAYLASAARLHGEASLAMRTEALVLEASGAATRFECTADPVIAPQGRRVLCPRGASLLVLEPEAGESTIIPASADVLVAATASRGEVIAWIDAGGVLWRREGDLPPERWADGFGAQLALALSPSGAHAVVWDRDATRLSWIDRTGGGPRTLDARLAIERDAGHIALTVTEHAVLAILRDARGVAEVRRYDGTERPLGDERPLETHRFIPRLAALSTGWLALSESDERVRVFDIDAGTDSSCAQTAVSIESLSLASEPTLRVAWLDRDPSMHPRVTSVDVASCTVTRAAVPDVDAVAIDPQDQTVALLSRSSGMREFRPASGEVGAPFGPSRPSGAFAGPIARGAHAFLLPGGPLGGAIWRGSPPWTSSLGVPNARVVEAAITPNGARAIIADDARRVLVYARPSSVDAPRTQWHDVSDRAQLEAATRSGQVHVSAMGGGTMAVTAAGLGAFVIESATGRIAWRAAQPLARAVDANARFALLALEDGTGERVDLTQRVRVSGSLGDPSPRVVAIDANGTRALVAGEHGTARWLDLSAEHWPAISTRAFHELEAADALATREDEFVVAASRLGFVTSATAAFANAPPAFYARHILEAEYAGPHRALLVDDHCAVWQSECTNTQCAADILVPEGHGCTVARVDANFTITTFPIPLLGLNDRRHGETGVLLYTVDRGGSTPAGIAIDDDAIVIAGPPIDPWLRRIALPPREPDAFDRWVAARTNATIGPNGGVVFRGP